ncbi:TerD family protein [Frankia tisae]|uniref:TerD family protein n=1 Tax=Frankia tisae TaxID=2950104 RepID=UPI0021C04788|nr:TerD family protein [Frankia tisae]
MTLAPTLQKGANTPVPTGVLRVSVGWARGRVVDVCALLVTDEERVRSDGDFVFFNAPNHPSGAVTLTAAGPGSAGLLVALPRVEPGVTRIVIAGSLDGGTFAELADLAVELTDQAGGPVARFVAEPDEPVTALVFGELYRRAGGWRFRAVAQGWDSGLAGLAHGFGIDVRGEGQPEAPAEGQAEAAAARSSRPGGRIRADWYPDPVRPDHMRWWDGDHWQGPPTPILTESDTSCGRCGARKRWRLLGGPPACEECAQAIRAYLWDWRARVVSSLTRGDPTGADLEPLWADLRYQRIPEPAGWEIVQTVGPAHLERLTAFALADGVIEQDEVDRIEAAAAQLRLAGPGLDALRHRLARGLELTRIGAGELPRLPAGSLHLELDEIVHLDVPATLVQQAAAGPQHAPGRLLATNRKLRFLGETGRGAELGLAKIVEVEARGGCVDIAATTSRGSGSYLVDDPQYVAAVLAGILRVARRQVIAPGSRASRAIPQAVKAEVWRRDGGVCVECGGNEHLEFDHVIPFSRGGASSVNNLQLLCRRCNRTKGARI